MKQLARLIKEHYGNGLAEIAERIGADGCNRHKKIFVKYLTFEYSPYCLFQYIKAYHGIRDKIQNSLNPSIKLNEFEKYRQRGNRYSRYDYPKQLFFLLSAHIFNPR